MRLRMKGMFGIIIIVAILLISSALYFKVIPRVEAQITTVFHEASNNVINVNTKVDNAGTIELNDIAVSILVTSGNQTYIDENFTQYKLSAGSEKEFKTFFYGDHYKIYMITITVAFTGDDSRYRKEFTYTAQDYMNIQYDETIKEWKL